MSINLLLSSLLLISSSLLISVSCSLQVQSLPKTATLATNNHNVKSFNVKHDMNFFATLENDDDQLTRGRFYRALFPALPLPTSTTPAPLPKKMLPCKASMTFGFGDATSEDPCMADPDGNVINPYHMKLLAAAVKNTATGRGMPEPDRSKDVPNLYDRVGRVLNPEAPKDYEVYKHVYDRMMQANGEGSYAAGEEEDAQPDARDGRSANNNNNNNGVCTTGCQRALPTSCCPVRTEIAYPQFARSAVTDHMIAIIQDMHNFIQPIYKRTCMSSKCNFMRGNCTQKYTPQAVFSAPITAVQSAVMANHLTMAANLTANSNANLRARNSAKLPQPMFGQDFILVESGCECRPDFETDATYTSPDDDEYNRFD